MTLDELVAELRENILFDRSDRTDGDSDLLWSTETLVRYINEAYQRFARLSLVLRDNTTAAVTQVTLVTGQTEYPLHRAVLAVASARLTGDVGDLARAGHSVLNAYRGPDPTYWDPAQLSQLPPGKPLVFTMDETMAADATTPDTPIEAPVLRVYPTPSATYNGQIIQLRVVRMPLTALTLGEDMATQTPELPVAHHLEMLDWAAYLALRVVDRDAGYRERALEFRASFEQHVKQARTEMLRKMHTPQPWGFGRHGFTWER